LFFLARRSEFNIAIGAAGALGSAMKRVFKALSFAVILLLVG